MDRPRVLVNCACSIDGKIAAPDGAPMPFSDEQDWRRVHRLRAESDAIMVGIGTVLNDDPKLKINPEYAAVPPNRKLLRVVMDAEARTPRTAHVVDGTAPTLIFVGTGVKSPWAKDRAEAIEVPVDPKTDTLELVEVLTNLHERGVKTLLVEGGARVLRSFLNSPFVDQWTLYQAPVLVGGNGPSIFEGKPSMIGRRLHVEHVEPQGKGVLWTLRP